MPAWLHKKLARAGRDKGLSGKNLKAYIYKTLNKYEVRKISKRKGVAKP